MHRSRSGAIYGLVVALVVLISACGGREAANAPDGGSGAERRTVRVGILGVIADAQFYVADELGYFDKQSLDVEFVTFASGADVLPAIASGQIDVAWTSFSAGLYNAVGRGVDVKFVAGNGKINDKTTSALVVAKGSGIDPNGGINQLAGKRVAINGLGVTPHAYLQMALAKAGLSVKDVHVETLGLPDQLPALRQGAIDAALPVDPLVAVGERQGITTTWMSYYELAGSVEHDSSLVVYSPKFAANADLGRRFMVAFLQGSRLVWQGMTEGDQQAREQVIDVLMKRVKGIEDRSIYDGVYTSGGHPNGEFTQASIDLFLDAYDRLGLIEMPADEIDFTSAIDMSFVEAALAEIGRYER